MGMKIGMIGHKRVPSREGGIEIAVEETALRLAAMGHQVDCYNRWQDFSTEGGPGSQGVQGDPPDPDPHPVPSVPECICLLRTGCHTCCVRTGMMCCISMRKDPTP